MAPPSAAGQVNKESPEVMDVRSQTQLFVLIALILLGIDLACAQDRFPGQPPDRRIAAIQQKADSLFEHGKYDRAFFIYESELAPIGDKYAQYMVGYMYLAGKGVETDIPRAVAWYRLAAERGDKTFVQEFDTLLAALSAEQRYQARQHFLALRPRLGDSALVMRLVEDDLVELSKRATSNTVWQTSSVGSSNFDRQQANGDRVLERIDVRMRYLEERLASDSPVIASEQERFAELQLKVRERLNSFNLR